MSEVPKFLNIMDAIPTPNAGMAPVVNRVMVMGSIYHTQGGRQPVQMPMQYSRNCAHTEQAFIRTTDISEGQELVPGFGYLDGITGEVMIQNTINVENGPQLLSAEVKKLLMTRKLRVMVEGAAFILGPGQFMVFQCESGTTDIRITVVPDDIGGSIPVRITAVPL